MKTSYTCLLWVPVVMELTVDEMTVDEMTVVVSTTNSKKVLAAFLCINLHVLPMPKGVNVNVLFVCVLARGPVQDVPRLLSEVRGENPLPLHLKMDQMDG